VLAPRDAWQLARRSIQGWIDDSASSMGAALAFYSLLSLAPLLLVVVGVAGMFWGRTEAQTLILEQVAGLVGDRAAAGIELVLQNTGQTAVDGVLPAVIGFATALFGAATVFNELQSDLDRIWRYHGRKAAGLWAALHTRMLAFGMVLAVGFLLMVSLVASAAISALSDQWLAGSQLSVRALEFGLSFLVMTGLFAMIYKILPRARIAWRDVWVGAAVTSVLFWLGKYLIGLYIGRASVANAFGAAGTVVVLIVWVYYSAQIFFVGAEFTREFALRHGSRQGTVQGRRRAGEAANEEEMVERAKAITAGKDPILLRRPAAASYAKSGGGSDAAG
jgi:membrane protein